jgi:DNA-binding response OmpR family regulator
MMSAMNFAVVPVAEVPRGDVRRSDGRGRVLVVHGDLLVADCIAMVLSRAGFDVEVAYDGPSGLERAYAMRPEMLVSDIALWGIDGTQLAMAVVNALPGCKVLLFSSHETGAEVLKARREGYDFPAMAKPVHPAEMMKRVLACFAVADLIAA